jgi:hypothetical protein
VLAVEQLQKKREERRIKQEALKQRQKDIDENNESKQLVHKFRSKCESHSNS